MSCVKGELLQLTRLLIQRTLVGPYLCNLPHHWWWTNSDNWCMTFLGGKYRMWIARKAHNFLIDVVLFQFVSGGHFRVVRRQIITSTLTGLRICYQWRLVRGSNKWVLIVLRTVLENFGVFWIDSVKIGSVHHPRLRLVLMYQELIIDTMIESAWLPVRFLTLLLYLDRNRRMISIHSLLCRTVSWHFNFSL